MKHLKLHVKPFTDSRENKKTGKLEDFRAGIGEWVDMTRYPPAKLRAIRARQENYIGEKQR